MMKACTTVCAVIHHSSGNTSENHSDKKNSPVKNCLLYLQNIDCTEFLHLKIVHSVSQRTKCSPWWIMILSLAFPLEILKMDFSLKNLQLFLICFLNGLFKWVVRHLFHFDLQYYIHHILINLFCCNIFDPVMFIYTQPAFFSY